MIDNLMNNPTNNGPTDDMGSSAPSHSFLNDFVFANKKGQHPFSSAMNKVAAKKMALQNQIDMITNNIDPLAPPKKGPLNELPRGGQKIIPSPPSSSKKDLFGRTPPTEGEYLKELAALVADMIRGGPTDHQNVINLYNTNKIKWQHIRNSLQLISSSGEVHSINRFLMYCKTHKINIPWDELHGIRQDII